jgi:hypothetical protein
MEILLSPVAGLMLPDAAGKRDGGFKKALSFTVKESEVMEIK